MPALAVDHRFRSKHGVAHGDGESPAPRPTEMLIRAGIRSRRMEAGDRDQILARLTEFLHAAGMDPVDVDVYVLSLRVGTLSTTSLKEHRPKLRGAKDRLDKLAQQGFFERTAGRAEGGVGRKSNPILFAPIPPTTALRQSLAAATAIVRDMELLDVLLESGPEHSGDEQVWVIDDEEAAFGKFAEALESASSEVHAFCRDGTWWNDAKTREALRQAAGRGVKIRVVGTEIARGDLAAMKEAKINAAAVKTPMTPFFVIDGVTLFLPHVTGRIGTRYRALRITNRYIIANLVGFVNHCFNGSDPT